ncbi:hypothetical protein CARUB_v10024606mg, partial [Capsella rubella]
MAPAEKLPSCLIGKILCRLPRKSLARFRAVSKTWNALWEDKNFLKKYLAHGRPQFIVWTNSQICSVGIIDLTTTKGFEVWSPWLRRKRLVENHVFRFCGLGYDNSKAETTGYKIFGYDFSFDTSGQLYQNVAIYDCKSDAWNFITNAPCEQDLVARQYNIRSFGFSKEMFKTFCHLPHSDQDFGYTQVLAVFRGDRFSLLRQSYMTRKIDIFVTKHKIDGNGEAVAWMCFMTVSIPEFPRLQHKCLDPQPSYFVDNKKRLFVCTCDETGHACIYIVKEGVFWKIPVGSMVDLWPSDLTYIP